MPVTRLHRQNIAVTGDGRLLCVPSSSVMPVSFKTGVVTSLPSSVPSNATDIFIDLDLSGGDVDVSSWVPSGIMKGATVRIRKTDESAFKLTYSDEVKSYDYVNLCGETLTLYYDGTKMCFDN